MFRLRNARSRIARWSVGLGSVLLLAGCPRPTISTNAGPSLSPPPPSGVASSFGPGDSFEVRVFGEAELSSKYRVGPDGNIDYPMCGALHVSGQTSSEVAGLITKCLQKYLKAPMVSVLEIEVGSRKKIVVFGYVQKPGTFPYEERMSIVQAVAAAGGFAQFAGQNSIVVTRVTEAGEEQRFKVPVQDIGTGKAPNFYLLPGDIVFIPESAL